MFSSVMIAAPSFVRIAREREREQERERPNGHRKWKDSDLLDLTFHLALFSGDTWELKTCQLAGTL